MNTGLSLELFSREFSSNQFWSTLGFPYMFYTFKLRPQLKLGRSEQEYGDFFSQIAIRLRPAIGF